MDEERFDRIVTEGRQKLTALLSPFAGAKGGQLIAYNAYFKGTEVAVLGYQFAEDGHTYTKPVAILVDEVVFGALEVDEESGRIDGQGNLT